MARILEGSKGGGGSTQAPTEAPNSLVSVERARILDLLCEGPIRGFHHGSTNPLQDVYLNGTPVANADGTFNFTNVIIDSRFGTQDQAAMPGFVGVENEIGVGVELRSTAPWVQAITDVSLSAVRLKLSVPQLQKSDTASGNIVGYDIDYKIELATDGGAYALVMTSSIGGKATGQYDRTDRIDLPPATTSWSIRITRLTANANLATVSDTLNILSYTEIIDAQFRYPNSAYVGSIVDAKQFSSVPSRAFDVYGRIMQVPSNYDPIARTYTGTWDGTFKPAWTNNPVWLFYDLVTHPRFGLGQWVDASRVNKWALYTIGQYCDELVPDGNGGTEPRFTCTLVLQAQADAYKVLADLSSVFRGMAFWGAGAIQAVADMPADPDFTYTNANVVGGKFSYQGSRGKTRFTVALVSWNDPSAFGKAKVAYVPDRDGIARYGVQQTSVIAVGATSEGQAQRWGQWILLSSRLETEVVTFEVGKDGTLVAPGRIARLADERRQLSRQGGRIHSATTTVVTLDTVPGTVAVGGSLTVMLPSGVTETQTISGISGVAVTVGTPFSQAPLPDATWVVETSTLEAPVYRILSIAEPKSSDLNGAYTVTAVERNASKFAAIDTGAAIQIPPTVRTSAANLPPPSTVTVTSFVLIGQVHSGSVLEIGWPTVPGASAYKVQYQVDNGSWSVVHTTGSCYLQFPGVKPGSYVAHVTAVNASVESTAAVSAAYIVPDASTLPTAVAAIQTEVNNAQADANAANAALANIASDGILSPVEKPVVIRDWNVISAEQAGIDTQATAFGITTEKTAYDSAVTALASYLGSLTTPVMWNNLTGDTTIVGATFRSNFASVYTTRQTLLNAIYAAAKVKADAAQGTANAANANVPAVINGQMKNGTTGWTFDNPTGFYQETGTNSPDSACNTYLTRIGQAGGSTTYARNLGYLSVVPGQTVTGMCCVRVLNANTSAYAGCRISWRDTNHAEISTTLATVACGPSGSGNAQCVSKVVGVAPAGAQFAHFELYYVSHSSGYIIVTSCFPFSIQPSSIDEVPDGSSRFGSIHNPSTQATIRANAAASYAPGQNMLPNPTAAVGNLHWPSTLSPVLPSAQYAVDGYRWAGFSSGDQSRMSDPVVISAGLQVILSLDMYSAGITGGLPIGAIQFYNGAGSVLSTVFVTATANAGWVRYSIAATSPANTASMKVYMRATPTGGGAPFWRNFKLEFGATATPYSDNATQDGNQLTNAGSGYRVGDQRNLLQRTVTNIPAKVPTTISYSATAGAPATATISIGAFTVLAGSVSVAYSAMSASVTGTNGTTPTYYLYFDDPGYAGGARTLVASTNANDVYAGDGYVYVGSVAVAYPSSGSGSGGGSGGGGTCVCADMHLLADKLAGEARVGDVLDCLNLPTGGGKFRRRVRRVTHTPSYAVRITTDAGAAIDCSVTTPFDLPDGRTVLAPDMLGELVVTDRGTETVACVDPIGVRPVVHLDLGGVSFAAGADPAHRIYSHNKLIP